jgi:hypothetical protein
MQKSDHQHIRIQFHSSVAEPTPLQKIVRDNVPSSSVTRKRLQSALVCQYKKLLLSTIWPRSMKSTTQNNVNISSNCKGNGERMAS